MYMVSRNNSWSVEMVSTKPLLVISVLLLSAMAIISHDVAINFTYAETGAGGDVFKVIMSVFGVEESRGSSPDYSEQPGIKS
jgi:hypothetical protein